MQDVETEDALNVLLESFDYEVYSIGDSGVLLRKETRRHRRIVIALPYGGPKVPRDVLEHIFQHTDFTMEHFWTAYDNYMADS